MRSSRLLLGAALGAVFVSLVGMQQASACDSMKQQAQFKTISVEELATALNGRAGVVVVDANGDETRAKFGVIPGAKLLSHYANYNPASELPADKASTLVFYCASTKCSAAPKAATKAADAGYTNVHVLEVGIKGWTEAGKPTSRPATT